MLESEKLPDVPLNSTAAAQNSNEIS